LRARAGVPQLGPLVVQRGSAATLPRMLAAAPTVTAVSVSLVFGRDEPGRVVAAIRTTASIARGRLVREEPVAFLAQYARIVEANAASAVTGPWRAGAVSTQARLSADFEGTNRLLHRLLIGQPMAGGVQVVGAADLTAEVFGRLSAAAAGFGIDEELRLTATAFRAPGPALGLATGHVVLALAVVHSLLPPPLVAVATGVLDDLVYEGEPERPR
jgi:hypothetical protein